ncbi:MAG TPA: hypothetical protein VG733_11485 [Chthoniobacteraceae bacterium]|nr:hypothetical protein [Chthoniobacteraceae bacterium]
MLAMQTGRHQENTEIIEETYALDEVQIVAWAPRMFMVKSHGRDAHATGENQFALPSEYFRY